MGSRRIVGHFGHCDFHNKRSYADRDSARALIRQQGWQGMRAYRCTAADGMWHIGHLPAVVRTGVLVAREVYGDGA